MRTRVRGASVVQGRAAEGLPEVPRGAAAPTVRHRGGYTVQGLGFLRNRLPERVVQEGRQGRAGCLRKVRLDERRGRRAEQTKLAGREENERGQEWRHKKQHLKP